MTPSELQQFFSYGWRCYFFGFRGCMTEDGPRFWWPWNPPAVAPAYREETHA